jgi:hypothetical protein
VSFAKPLDPATEIEILTPGSRALKQDKGETISQAISAVASVDAARLIN